jgi:hypothetical protein
MFDYVQGTCSIVLWVNLYLGVVLLNPDGWVATSLAKTGSRLEASNLYWD